MPYDKDDLAHLPADKVNVGKALQPPPPPPAEITMDTGQRGFDGGVPVNWWTGVTIWPDGSYRFWGHFHDSGGIGYDVSSALVVVDSNGVAYSFSKSGHVEGTADDLFSPDRDLDWDERGHRPELAAAYAAIAGAGPRWECKANADANLGALVSNVVALIETAGTVVKTVVAVVG
jgi:hypothetical protein